MIKGMSVARQSCERFLSWGQPPKTGEAVLREAEGRADVPCGGVSLYSTHP